MEESRIKVRSKASQLEGILKRQITQGHYHAGDKFPSERALAEKYRLSKLTVSKVLSNLSTQGLLYREQGKGTYISQELPSLSSSSRRIALVTRKSPDSRESDPFLSRLVDGILSSCKERDYTMQLSRFTDMDTIDRESVLSPGVKGLILGSLIDLKIALKVREMGIPLVWVDNEATGVELNCVCTDYFRCGYLGGEHLIKLGHKKIGLIIGPPNLWMSKMVHLGYRTALENYGIAFEDSLVKPGEFGSEGGYRRVRELLNTKKRLTAVYVAGDVMALGAMNAILDSGMIIPGDIAVVGQGAILPPTMFQIPLTTLDTKIQRRGELAAELLIDIMEGKNIPESIITIKPELKIRESCGALKMKKELREDNSLAKQVIG